jgi:hypothetical protein
LSPFGDFLALQFRDEALRVPEEGSGRGSFEILRHDLERRSRGLDPINQDRGVNLRPRQSVERIDENDVSGKETTQKRVKLRTMSVASRPDLALSGRDGKIVFRRVGPTRVFLRVQARTNFLSST